MVLGLFGAVFVVLFVAFAIFNARRLEATLVQVQVNKALSIVEGVQKKFEEFVVYLNRTYEPAEAFSKPLLLTETDMAVEEALATALIDMVRDLDFAEEQGTLESSHLAEIAEKAHVRAIAFVDSQGRVVHESAPVPEEILQEAVGVMERGEGTGSGAVVVVLGEEELAVWKTRAALQEAIEVAGWRKGVVYFAVTDRDGNVLAQAGDVPKPNVPSAEARVFPGHADVRVVRRHGVSPANVLEVVLPMTSGEQFLGEVHMGLDPGETDRLMASNRRQIYIATGMMILLALLAGGFLSRSQSRHHARLTEMRERLHQAERLSSLGRLSAAVAHEVRNPLNAISLAVQRLAREYRPPDNGEEFVQLTRVLREEIRRIDRIIQEFLGLTRTGALQVEEVPVGELLERLRVLLQGQAAFGGVRVTVSKDVREPRVLVDRDRIMQALVNLAKNALEAMPDGGALTLGYRCEGKGWVVLEIADTGKGLGEADIQKVFDPGFSTKEGGLGLGLHIAREIVRLHGGDMTVRSREGEGSIFSLWLPCGRTMAQPEGGSA
jgi:signal transduction histidine kinase